ncbi:HNH endonuclease [Candidatus Nomurabacteria bacterium]|nr:HNH endonuclease [Candidatus Nomurabacteria bacterium]
MPTIYRPKKQTNNYTATKVLAQKHIYNTKHWKTLRLSKLMNDPLCEICLINGMITPAVEVHHITPFMQGTSLEQIKFLGFDYDNLQSLCTDCHKQQHNK